MYSKEHFPNFFHKLFWMYFSKDDILIQTSMICDPTFYEMKHSDESRSNKGFSLPQDIKVLTRYMRLKKQELLAIKAAHLKLDAKTRITNL